MANRVYRIEGREVSQAEYLDYAARKSGFPGGRREREAYRRAVKAGKVAPVPTRPYKPQAPGTPGGRGRKSPVPPRSRSRDVWHSLGGGGRVKVTGSSSIVHSAIRGAHRKNQLIFLTVKGDVKARYEQKSSDQGEAAFREGIDPADLLAAIDAAGGNVKRGIANALMETGRYDSIENISSFAIRAYE